MARTAGAQRRTMVHLALDSAIFIGFLVATAPRFTGIAIHEWLSIAFSAAVIAHLLLHWQWIIEIARRFFGKVTWMSRVNYALNSLLFVSMTIIIFTGLMISEAALPLFGIQMPNDRMWSQLHHQSSDFTVLLLGLHVALHWRWTVNATRRALAFLARRQATPEPVPAVVPASREVR